MPNPLKVALYASRGTLRDWMAPAADLPRPAGEFVTGINLGGQAVAIDGDRWQSYAAALAAGLSTPGATAAATHCLPTPHASQPVRAMLNSVVFKTHRLELEYPLPSGHYHLYLWMMENFQTHWHRLTVQGAGQTLAEDIGHLPLGGWARYGPYPIAVADAPFHLSLTSQAPNIDAHLMGLSFYRP